MRSTTIPVSVIIPNYNSGIYLADCINSINSGPQPFEIIVVDDCSTDDSFDLAIKLQARYSNIKLLKREKNGGAAEARKSGIAVSTQDLIAFVDADDLLEADSLSVAYSVLNASQADICIWELWRFDDQRQWRHGANPTVFPITGREAVLLTLGEWRIHPLGISRKNIYEKAYSGFEERTVNADELVTRLAFSHAKEIIACKKKYLYRSNPMSSTQSINARWLSTLRSHLWLLNFASQYPEAPVSTMARLAIGQAWYCWQHRKQLGYTETLSELRDFLPEILRHPGLWTWLWRHPKYLGGLMIMSVAAWRSTPPATSNSV